MADINLKGLYQQKQREFNTVGQGTSIFPADFIDAVNNITAQINLQADLATPISRVAGEEDTVVGMDVAYLPVLSNGVSLELLRMGQRPAPGAEGTPKVLQKLLDAGISQIYFKIKNDIQASNAAGTTTTDVIGLGDLS